MKRKIVKILHTIAACGIIGGAACYILLLIYANQDSAARYAETRELIAAICNYVMFPSLGLVIVSGLLSMVVHTPFLDKGWVWIKALTGILMFQAVLVLVVGEANNLAALARAVADGEAAPEDFNTIHQKEFWTLGVVLAISLVNIVLGVWRPRIMKPTPSAAPLKGAGDFALERKS